MTFLSFCGNSTFWNDDIFTSDVPKFTDCFITIVPAFVPIAWLILTFPFYVIGLLNYSSTSLPVRSVTVFKTGICILLALLSLFDLYANDRYGYRCDSDRSIPTSFILSSVLNVVSFLYLAIVTQINRRKGVISSWLLWIFWLFVLLCGIIPLQDNILNQPSCLASIINYISFGFFCIQFVLYSLAEHPSVYGYQRIGKPVCPKPYSSVISKLFFWWFTPVVRTCYKTTINKEDLWDQHPDLQAEKVVNDLHLLWSAEEKDAFRKRLHRQNSIYRSEYNKHGNIPGEETSLLERSVSHDDEDEKRNVKTPSLYKCCIRLYTLEWFRAACMKLLCDISILLQPLILKLIVKETEKASDDRIVWYGVVLALLIYIAGQLDAMFYIHASQLMVTLGLKVKTALIGVIYRKTLKVSSSVRKDYTVGEVVNLVSVDCQRIQDAFTYSHEILSFFFVLTVGVYELWNVMGASTIGCLLVIVILTFCNVLFGKLQQGYLMNILYYKGKRCKLLNEIIFGIKVIKMYAWEPYFSRKIKSIRMKEMAILRKIARVTACSIVCAAHSPFMMNFSILLIYTLASTTEPFNAEKAFLALSVVNILRFPLTMIPFVITGVIQAIVSIKRIQQFLLTDDVNPRNVQYLTSADYAISIHRGSFTWEKNTERPTLGGINVNIPEGKLVAVVGQVGSGKTSFISSILGELEKLEGDVKIKGSVAYISQEAWIQNMTVRDNILYGHTVNEKKYDRVLESCCLKSDLKILSAGDMTEIGERGINLSGGQKQRVNLARAVYSNCDIYLFDDPLSAVDSHVGKDLFKKVIGPEGMLRHKTRILVTHGVHWLPNVDEIIVLSDGRISEQGTFKQLVQHNGPFAQFLQIYLLQEDAEDDIDPEISQIKDNIWDQVESVTSDGGFTSEDNFFSPAGMSRRQSMRRLSRQGSIVKLERSLSSAMIKANMSRRESRANLARKASAANISRQTSTTSAKQKQLEVGAEGQLIQEEAAQEGSVNLSVLIDYMKAMGIPAAIIAFIALVVQQGLNIYSNFWITFWTEDSYLKNATLIDTPKYADTKYYYLGIYALLGTLQGITLFMFAIISLSRFVKATGKLHDKSLECIFHSPMAFFDTTPVGRIMNRFSSDIDVIDDRFPRTFRIMSVMSCVLLGTIIVIGVTTPISVVVIIPMIILYIVAIKLYLPSARQLKRIESVTRSPLYNHFSETISGASIIRAYRSVDRFIDEIHRRLDMNSSYYYAANTGMAWIGVIIESLGNLILLAVALFGILSSDVNGADIGLALTYSFQIIIAMNIVVRGVSEMQMNVVSIERVEEYMYLPPEADWIQQHRPEFSWPRKGTIQFDNYKTRYRPGLELVLKGIDCFIRNGERIGIVGRTGAGKSSLAQALFRLIEPAEGSIIIDDVTTTTIGLHDLRQKITILPQDPVLFSDTLRVNLDPLGKFSDTEIWTALECAHLKQFAMNQSGQLISELGEGGNNLSVGQRQLVCLARTLLHKTNILILDEATAAVDMETDDLIQQTITEQFADCTILSIAHRLNTVMEYDRIMVMDKGMISEFDSPETLLQNKEGVFYSMAKDAGII